MERSSGSSASISRASPPGSRHGRWNSGSFLILLVMVAAFSGRAETDAESSVPVGDASALIEHDYVGVAKCKSCHGKELMGDQVSAWKSGPHHSSWLVLQSPQALRVAEEKGLEGPPSEAPECLACHVTAFGVPPERISRPLQPSDGVQCESCHGPGRSYRKKKIMADLDRARASGLWTPSAQSGLCERCHNAQSPTFKTDRFMRADGSTAAFDYDLAVIEVAHPIPEHVKGKYLELDEARKKAEKAQKGD